MSPALSQAEAIIGSLSYQERLWLIEWLARQLRAQAPPADFQRQIALMAADAAIQAELRAIEQEFASAEEERPLYETATPEELAQAFLAWAHGHSNNSPGLTLEDVSRETIYEDR